MPRRLITSEADHDIAEIASPLRVAGTVTLSTFGASSPGFSPPNAHQRWEIDEIMLSASGAPAGGQTPVATLNAPLLGNTTVTTGGISGATQPLTMELFLNEGTSPGNSIGSTTTGIFTTRKIRLWGSERLIVQLTSDSHWSGVVVTVIITGTRYQRRR